MYATDVDSGETRQILDDGPVFINGLGFDPDGSKLLVTATLSSQLLSYDAGAYGSHRAGAHLRQRLAGRDGGQRPRRLLGGAYRGGPDRHRRRVRVERRAGRAAGRIAADQHLHRRRGCDELFVTAAQSQALLRIRFDGNDPEAALLRT